MNMHTSSELATKTRAVCGTAREQGCAIIATNGKADLAMIDLSPFDTINEFIHVYDEWRMKAARNRMHAQAERVPMTLDDIDAEIAVTRAESRMESGR